MEKCINFSEIQVDPAPFQLVEKSSLLKVIDYNEYLDFPFKEEQHWQHVLDFPFKEEH